MAYQSPKTPKKPHVPRRKSRNRISFLPHGKSSVLLKYIYVEQQSAVILCRNSKLWTGCIPLPSSSRRRAKRFCVALKNWDTATRMAGQLLFTKARHFDSITGAALYSLGEESPASEKSSLRRRWYLDASGAGLGDRKRTWLGAMAFGDNGDLLTVSPVPAVPGA